MAVQTQTAAVSARLVMAIRIATLRQKPVNMAVQTQIAVASVRLVKTTRIATSFHKIVRMAVQIQTAVANVPAVKEILTVILPRCLVHTVAPQQILAANARLVNPTRIAT